MHQHDLIWRSGDPWRNLNDDVGMCEAVTVISRNGTARFFDLAGGRHNRLPLEAGHTMWLDTCWRPLERGSGPRGWALAVTPCGLNVLGALDWAMGTPLWAVFDGLWSASPAIGEGTDWITTPVGRSIVDAIVQRRHPQNAKGHPPEHCGALYCPQPRA